MKIEDISEGSLWAEQRGEKYLWRLRFFNPNINGEDKGSVTLTSQSSQAKTKDRKI